MNIPLHDFFKSLEQNGFMVSIDQITDATRVIRAYGKQVKDENNLCAHLSAIFAKSQEEQSLFKVLFKEHFSPASKKKEEQNPSKRNWWQWLLVLLLVCSMAAGGYYLYYLPQKGCYSWLGCNLPQYQISINEIEDDVQELKLVLNQAKDSLSEKSYYRAGYAMRIREINWGDNAKDTLPETRHKYKSSGSYRITTILDYFNQWGEVISTDTLSRDLKICHEVKLPLSIALTPELETYDIGQEIDVFSDYPVREVDSTYWQIPEGLKLVQNIEGGVRLRLEERGQFQITFVLVNKFKEIKCNQYERVEIVVEEPYSFAFNPSPASRLIPYQKERLVDLVLESFRRQWGLEGTSLYLVSFLCILLVLGLPISFVITLVSLSIKNVLDRRTRQKSPAQKIPLSDWIKSLDGSKGPKEVPFLKPNELISTSTSLGEVSKGMLRRYSSSNFHLSLPKTISEAIHNFGFFNPVFENKAKQLEFLVLIERNRPEDPQTQLFDFLLDRIQSRNVRVDKYYYEDTPLLCHSPKGTFSLEKLKEGYPDHFLLLLGDASTLLYKEYASVLKEFKEISQHWQNKALVTPASIYDWGRLEEIIQETIPVLSADSSSLKLLGKLLINRQYDLVKELRSISPYRTSLAAFDFEDVEGVKSYCKRIAHAVNSQEVLLEEVLFQWIASLAVYPKVRWELLVETGYKIFEKSKLLDRLNYDVLLQIILIPWVRLGRVPEDLRLDLLKVLSTENELLVREVILNSLNQIQQDKINNSHFAYEEMEVQRVTNEFLLFAHDSEKYKEYESAVDRYKSMYQSGLIMDATTLVYIVNEEGNGNSLIPPSGSKYPFGEGERNELESYFDKKNRESFNKEQGSDFKLRLWSNLIPWLIFLLGFGYYLSQYEDPGRQIVTIRVSNEGNLVPDYVEFSIDSISSGPIENLKDSVVEIEVPVLVDGIPKQINWDFRIDSIPVKRSYVIPRLPDAEIRDSYDFQIFLNSFLPGPESSINKDFIVKYFTKLVDSGRVDRGLKRLGVTYTSESDTNFPRRPSNAIYKGRNVPDSIAVEIENSLKREGVKIVGFYNYQNDTGRENEISIVYAVIQGTDSDGDGVDDVFDECPEVVGLESNSGCPQNGEEVDSALESEPFDLIDLYYLEGRRQEANGLAEYIGSRFPEQKFNFIPIDTSAFERNVFLFKMEVLYDDNYTERSKIALLTQNLQEKYTDLGIAPRLRNSQIPGVRLSRSEHVAIFIPFLTATGDFDGDGVTNINDKCPFESGTDEDGCVLLPFKRNFNYIPKTISTSEGPVQILFGVTQSDGLSADQKVSPLLVQGFTEILETANVNLIEDGFSKISTIFVNTTTNGKHSKNSNSYKGAALSISRINGIKIIYINESELVSVSDINRNIFDFNSEAAKNRDEYTDYDKLAIHTYYLQRAIEQLSFRRENFGPFLKSKLFKERGGTVAKNYYINGHLDFIHFSVR